MSEKSWPHRLGAAFGKFIVRVPILVALIWFLFWVLSDQAPRELIWFIAGAMFNDFLRDSD